MAEAPAATLLPMTSLHSEFSEKTHSPPLRQKGSHGGRRAGSGRKPLPPHLKKQRRKQFEEQNKQIRLKRDLIGELEAWGESHGMKRTNYSEIISYGMKIIRKAEGTDTRTPVSPTKTATRVSPKMSQRGKRKPRYCGEDDDYIYEDESDSDYEDMVQAKKLKKELQLEQTPPSQKVVNALGATLTSPTMQEIEDMGLPEDKQLLLEAMLKLRKDMWSEKADGAGTNPLLSMQSNQDALHMKGGGSGIQSGSGSEQEIQPLEEDSLEMDEAQLHEDEEDGNENEEEEEEVTQQQQTSSQKGQSSHKEE